MKSISIVFVALAIAIATSLSSSAEVFKAPVKQTVEFTDTATLHTYQIKDVEYPIYKSRKGRFYIWKTSKKTNKQYKYYLPKEIQKQIEEHNKLQDDK